jgi:hypothetical protein
MRRRNNNQLKSVQHVENCDLRVGTAGTGTAGSVRQHCSPHWIVYDHSGLIFDSKLRIAAFSLVADDSKRFALHISLSPLQVEPRTEECFYEDLKVGNKLTINFEVIRGGLLDIEFKLKDPMGNIAFQRLAFFNHKYAFRLLFVSSLTLY